MVIMLILVEWNIGTLQWYEEVATGSNDKNNSYLK
jgi:hypothetical protein